MSRFLFPLAVGGVAGAGLVAAAPHFAAGTRRGFRPHLQAALAKKQVGPLGTVNDAGPDVFKFASSEISPMHNRIFDEVYVAQARGHLSETEVAHLETFSAELVKEASFGQAFQYGLGTAAATAVGGLAMMGASHGIHSMYDSMTFEKDLQATLKVRPELSAYPKEQVRLVYQSLRRLSPEIAKDPLTASTYLVRQFERRNPSDPHSLPTVELETARTLTQVTGELGKKRDNVRDTLLEANRMGVQAGLSAYQDAQRDRRSQRLETYKAKLRGDLDMAKETREEGRRSAAEAKRAIEQNQIGGLQQALAEMTNRASAAEARVDSMEQKTNRDLSGILRSPVTNAAFGIRTSLPMTTRRKK